MTSYGKRSDPVKGLESSCLFYIILVGPKCHHLHLYEKEAEEVLTQTHTEDKAMQRQGQVQPQARVIHVYFKLMRSGTFGGPFGNCSPTSSPVKLVLDFWNPEL